MSDSTPQSIYAETELDTVGATASASNSPGVRHLGSAIRRQRASYRCERCRDRRVKCDQVHPVCGMCAKSGSQCRYPDNNLKRKQFEADQRLQEDARISRRKVEAAPPRLGYLSLQTGGRSRYLENTFWACVDEENLELDSFVSELPLFPLDSFCCSASQQSRGKTKQHSPSCRHYIGSVEPNFSFWISGDSSNIEMGCRELATILEELPSRDSCDEMHRMFIGGIHPLIPLLHLPSFNQHYDSFWDWYETWDQQEVPESILAETPSFLPLLFAVLFTGCFASDLTTNAYQPTDQQQQQHETMQTRLYRLTLNSLALVGFPQNPAVYSLIAFLLTQNLLIREEESLSSCSFVSVAFRIAQAMGIHRDGTFFGLDPIEIEVRRRIWWHLMHVDVMTSIISGLPPTALNETYSDTKMMGELKDEHIDKTREGPEKDNDDFWLWSPYVLTAGRYDATSCIRNILRRQFSLQSMTSRDVRALSEIIQNLSVRIEERITRLKSLTFKDAIGHDPLDESSQDSVDSFNTWTESLLRLMIDKAYCLLYQPLIRDRPLWEEVRPEAIPRFQSFLRVYIHMCNTKPYRPFKWLYPGSYQPLQPTAVLLIDLMNKPNSAEARTSRILLEAIFSLLGPEGRISSGGAGGSTSVSQRFLSGGAKDAWGLLDRLRKKVWRKLGLDSSIHWARSLPRHQENTNSSSIDVTRDPRNWRQQTTTASQRQAGPSMFSRTSDVGMPPLHGYPITEALPMNIRMPTAPGYNTATGVSAARYQEFQQDVDELNAEIPTVDDIDWSGWDSMHGGFI